MIKINKIQVNSYLTTSKLPDADYVINPYIGCPHKCIYCYAEFMKRFTDHIDDNWGDFLDIKLCETPIKLDKLTGCSILFGSVTDAYNPFEKKHRITRKILSNFIGSEAKIEILTKSDLIIRDIDLLKKIPNIRIGISMNSLDDTFRKKTEPFASSVPMRIKSLQTLHDAGIDTYLFMSPIFPEITQFVKIIERVQPFVNSFYFENLNLRGSYMPRVLSFISNNFPEHTELFDRIYKKKELAYWEKLAAEINQYCISAKIDYKLYFYHEKIKKGARIND